MTLAPAAIDFELIRQDFPILEGSGIAYLDNGATSQKPSAVIEAVASYYRNKNANVHRGVHRLSQLATEAFDKSREDVRRLLNAPSAKQVIFTRGCTESINMVASGLSTALDPKRTGPAQSWLKRGDVILISAMEHHSNIVPWQMAAARVGAEIHTIPITDDGEIDLDAYTRLLQNHPVKIVAVNHVSNALGTINPVKHMTAMAHRNGARMMIDGAQAGPHMRIDVQDLDADYYSLSCHKIYAPTGIGVLYGKMDLLEELTPFEGGGDMIHTVSLTRGTTYAALPARLEAGTPNIAGAIGLGAAVRYLEGLTGDLKATFEQTGRRESQLAEKARNDLGEIPGLKLHGNAKERAGIVSFTLDCAHPHDIGTILDDQGVAVRAGHHCCMPLMERLAVPATARASFAFYNTPEDVDRLVSGVRRVRELFG